MAKQEKQLADLLALVELDLDATWSRVKAYEAAKAKAEKARAK